MAEVVGVNEDEIILQVKVKLRGSLIEMEQDIQAAVKEVGALATQEALNKFDTTEAPIKIGNIRMTSKGKTVKKYETPFGSIDLARHVYQTLKGGVTYCPLDEKARIITSSTPRFAKILSNKYA